MKLIKKLNRPLRFEMLFFKERILKKIKKERKKESKKEIKKNLFL